MAIIATEIALVTGGMFTPPAFRRAHQRTTRMTRAANSGIGFELAHQLLARGTYHVLLGARSSQKGSAALRKLQSRKLSGSIGLVHLDVRRDEHISEVAQFISDTYGKLDILVNNAAVAMPEGATERERLHTAFDVNATGPYLLTKALIPLLRKSTNPRIINISSGAGSLGRRLFPQSPMYKIQGIPYRACKVAFNMITACLHVEYGLGVEQIDSEQAEREESKGTTMKVFCYDPGFTISNLGPQNKTEFGARSAEDTVVSIMELVDGKRDGEVGRFIHNTGEYPW